MAKKKPQPAVRDRNKGLRKVRVADLEDAPWNFRTHPDAQRAALEGAVEEIGWFGYPDVYETPEGVLRLCDGHLRKALLLAKYGPDAEVEVNVTDFDEAEAKKATLTKDPLAAMATADAAKLDALLREVQTASAPLAEMLTALAEKSGAVPSLPAPGAGGDEFDATPAEGPTRTQPGDLWMIDGGRHRVLCGDSTKAEDVARLMGGDKAALMVTDPPYGVEYEPTWREGAIKTGELTGTPRRGVQEVANDDQMNWSDALGLFAGGVVYCWHASWHASIVQQTLLDLDFEIRSQIIWRKPNFVISRGHYHFQHEPCWYAVRKGATASWAGDRSQTTIWDIASLQPMGRSQDTADAATGHGTQKPVECMARPIRNHGAEGDIVYDPFLGSGTTLIAAHRLGRKCYGAEIEPKYVSVILRRCEAEGLSVEKG